MLHVVIVNSLPLLIYNSLRLFFLSVPVSEESSFIYLCPSWGKGPTFPIFCSPFFLFSQKQNNIWMNGAKCFFFSPLEFVLIAMQFYPLFLLNYCAIQFVLQKESFNFHCIVTARFPSISSLFQACLVLICCAKNSLSFVVLCPLSAFYNVLRHKQCYRT